MSDDAQARPISREETIALVQRYDRPGPRYTSYPTAVEFHEGVDAAEYARRLEKADEAVDEPLSIYVHLPFCEKRCLFCACHVIITPHMEKAAPYLDLLEKEIDLVTAHLKRRRKVSQLHLGGGTPTYYTPAQLDGLLGFMMSKFELTDDAEVAVEVDPRVTTPEHLDVMAKHGFNRVSMGVQDFTHKVQEAVDRVQSFEQTKALIDHARSRGYGRINVDLIYGLPFQTLETFEQTIQTVIDLGIDRTAVYSFAFLPDSGRGHQKRIEEKDLPAPEVKLGLYALAREKFLEAGYEAIGMDHFALPTDELAKARKEGRLRRNFQGYTIIPAKDVIGLGISAIGDLAGAYVQNLKKLNRYQKAVEAGELPVLRGVARTPDDEVRRTVIHEMMCNFRVDIPTVEKEHGIAFAEFFKEELERLKEHEAEGLVAVTPERIDVTPRGELFVRNLGMCFDRYWHERHKDSDKTPFSRTV